ncbi:putative membrane protein [Halanaeroarchaeum sp. HSR-CO]|uniref:YeiH family protein n=1 Tax=Halanaeroarchaeum sp. HSR-CO TaxID=2866382 RepID=UPI00217F2166|nr:YeiH family protein [Halanaeroarchaeum sp. HSR-CO]UWG46327.1 putative membrane protein [Halanaeroarchaeum sp. HSR-CO]
MVSQLREAALHVLPGLLLLFVVGIAARIGAGYVPVVNYLILAVVLGAVLVNLFGLPAWASAGVSSHKLLLEAGIVLMGARISLAAVSDAGPKIVVLVVATVAFTAILTELLSRNVFGLANKMGSLMASGAAICGVSAIVAVAGGIDAKKDQIAFAVATILLFDAVTLFVYPILGTILNLQDVVFGVWAGLSMFSTGPVAAAGFAYSDTAGQWATMTKLTRNLFIGLAVIAYAGYYARAESKTGTVDRPLGLFWQNFPKFVLGFVAMMVIANVGILSDGQLATLENSYKWLFLFAFAGLGMGINVDEMRATGFRPVLLTLTALTIVSITTLVVVSALFGV